ncbi:MAG: ribonuclease HII [Pseudomonadota bacterium]
MQGAAAGHAGVDEVGIGPLAGPVIAAAVVLDPERSIEGLTDSKALSAKKREALAEEIKSAALAWAIAAADEAEIDHLNILQASHLAMRRAIDALKIVPPGAFVDGNKVPALGVPTVAVVKGDRLVPQISAASIIAKVERDSIMLELDKRFPAFGFAKHKGYPTKAHFAALETHGVSPVHRRSFAPVAKALAVSSGKADSAPGQTPSQTQQQLFVGGLE